MNMSRPWKYFGPRTEKAQWRSALPLCRPVGQSCALWSELWWWCGRQRLRSGRIRDRLEVWEVWGRPLLYSFYSHHFGNNGGQPVKTNGFCEGAFFRVQNPTSPPFKTHQKQSGLIDNRIMAHLIRAGISLRWAACSDCALLVRLSAPLPISVIVSWVKDTAHILRSRQI